nr:MAG TPA: hypothetical protein [Caudoviricetes sp.]
MAIFILNIPCQAYRFREVVKEQAAYLYHRNLTSAGYSASSVEKYHYLSDCHRHIGCNPILIAGVLAVLKFSEVSAYSLKWLSSELKS